MLRLSIAAASVRAALVGVSVGSALAVLAVLTAVVDGIEWNGWCVCVTAAGVL